jgi:hypothetical protein
METHYTPRLNEEENNSRTPEKTAQQTPVTSQQAPAQEPFVPQGQESSGGASAQVIPEYKDSGWSWGAFALNWMFVIATRNYVYLFLLLLMLVPFVNFLVMIGFAIYMGINGREMARKSKTFANHEQYLGFMKGLDHVSKVVAYFYVVLLGLFIVGIIVVITLASLSNARDGVFEVEIKNTEKSVEIQRNLDDGTFDMI